MRNRSPACLILLKLHFIFVLLSPAKQGKLSSLFPPLFDRGKVTLLGACWAECSDSALFFTKDPETWTHSVSLFAEWHGIVTVLGKNKMIFEARHRRTDAEAETPILWPPHAKIWLIGKDPDAGKHCGQEEKGTTEDEMAGWHHWLDAHEFGLTPGVGDGQGGLVCYSSWGRKESDMTEQLNWTELITYYIIWDTKESLE